jgi:hypothetical protein
MRLYRMSNTTANPTILHYILPQPCYFYTILFCITRQLYSLYTLYILYIYSIYTLYILFIYSLYTITLLFHTILNYPLPACPWVREVCCEALPTSNDLLKRVARRRLGFGCIIARVPLRRTLIVRYHEKCRCLSPTTKARKLWRVTGRNYYYETDLFYPVRCTCIVL